MIWVISERNKRMSDAKASEMMSSEASAERERMRTNTKLSTKMIKWVAVCLIICYFPYLLWWQYARSHRWHSESGCKNTIRIPEVSKAFELSITLQTSHAIKFKQQ
jgi:hypothetical protein